MECIFCGDACGMEICYGCEDTAETMGLDVNELMEVM